MTIRARGIARWNSDCPMSTKPKYTHIGMLAKLTRRLSMVQLSCRAEGTQCTSRQRGADARSGSGQYAVSAASIQDGYTVRSWLCMHAYRIHPKRNEHVHTEDKRGAREHDQDKDLHSTASSVSAALSSCRGYQGLQMRRAGPVTKARTRVQYSTHLAGLVPRGVSHDIDHDGHIPQAGHRRKHHRNKRLYIHFVIHALLFLQCARQRHSQRSARVARGNAGRTWLIPPDWR